MNVEKLDCVVIGAGVVGLAVARAFSLAGREVVVIEKEAGIGMETSSRNSEVIHAGIYYPTGSLKARACVEGKAKLYHYLRERGLPHSNCGKLIVAANGGQRDRLLAIRAKAEANGVNDMRLVERDELSGMEPALSSVAALLSPSTGIVDSHAYMLALQGDAEAKGAFLALNTPVLRGKVLEDGILIETGGPEPMVLSAKLVINSAGLAAPLIARRIAGMPDDMIPAPHYAKGNYFTLSGRSPFSRLIYPMPEQGGLGVHLTLDLGGQAKFGPDVEWLEGVAYEAIDYTVDPSRGEKFYAAIRSYWPDLKDGALATGYSGVRPKIAARGAPDGDFTIQGPAVHGVPGLINLFGIESPGLTSSLALADMVAEMAA